MGSQPKGKGSRDIFGFGVFFSVFALRLATKLYADGTEGVNEQVSELVQMQGQARVLAIGERSEQA